MVAQALKENVDALLSVVEAAGRTAWPGVAVDRAVLARHLQAHAPNGADLEAFGADLFLAVACLDGDPVALASLERECFSQVGRYVAQLNLTESTVKEVTQLLRIRVLTGPTPRLGMYAGRGPLGVWMRIAALRVAHNLLASERTAGRAVDDDRALEALVTSVASPEALIDIQARRQLFQAALDEALAGLSSRDRSLLRLHFIDGLNIEGIGAIYGVHRATAARWLIAIRARVLGGIQRQLASDLPLTSAEFRSLVRLVRSQLSVSLSRLPE